MNNCTCGAWNAHQRLVCKWCQENNYTLGQTTIEINDADTSELYLAFLWRGESNLKQKIVVALRRIGRDKEADVLESN